MRIKHLDISNHKIWRDKNIKPEAKEIYAYLFAEGFERTISHISIGRIQRELKSITNPSLTVTIYKKFIFLLKIGFFFVFFCDIIFT